MSALIRITNVVPDPVAGCLPAALRAPTASAGPAGTVPPDDDAALSTTSAMGDGTALRRWGPAVAELGLAMAEDFVPGLAWRSRWASSSASLWRPPPPTPVPTTPGAGWSTSLASRRESPHLEPNRR